jgi:nanoRNase/pAp phosphatase (c-di-AMP/oligoRNAs hydrolase)
MEQTSSFIIFMDFSKAIELIEKAQHIAILLRPDPDLDCLTSAEVLAKALEAQGKKVGFPASELAYELIVSLDTSVSPVNQLRYEKGENCIDIIFSPKEKSINREAISFREGKVLCDCVFTIGVENTDALDKATPELLGEAPIINLDISGHNAQYGEANLVWPEKSSRAEIVYEFLTSLSQEPLSAVLATKLLAAILYKTGQFSAQVSADTLLVSSELLRLGANLAEARGLAETAKSPSLLQLQGRAMVRSRLDESKGVLWSFMTAEDFEKTGRSSADIPQVLAYIRKEFPAHTLTALLWQQAEGGGIRATLAGDRAVLEALEARGAGKSQSPHLLISSTFESFREAEDIVGSLLASVL